MLNLSLDRKNDILYIKINSTNNSYGDETENGVVILKDLEDDNITGITIFDFVKRYKENRIKDLKLPIHIDFNEDIYPKIKMC